MKRMYILFALCMAAMAATAQDFDPQWMQDLRNLNVDIIDSTQEFPPHRDAPNYRTVLIYFHQPLDHANPQGPQFPMRALITVNTNGDPTTAVNHVYCTGYAMDYESLIRPDSVYGKAAIDCTKEIGRRYEGNFIQIEHRYYQYSAPYHCWEDLDNLTAEQAAADFHNLFEAMKKVLKGKWVMSGVSKGGITTLLQHNFYPNDMDIYVPYSAPFFDSDRTLGMQSYWNNQGWSEEFNDLFMNIRRAGTANLVQGQNGPWNMFYTMYNGTDTTQAHTDSVYASYLSNLAGFGYAEKAYSDTNAIRKQLYINDSIIRSLGYTSYNDTVIAYMLSVDSFRLNYFKPWLDTLRKYTGTPQQRSVRRLEHRRIAPFGVTENEWWGPDTTYRWNGGAYEYQAKRELGYYDVRFDELCATPEEAAALNEFWVNKAGCARDLMNPWFASLSFNRALYDQVMASTQNATKPIILLYGQDDPWTGAAVQDLFINGQNVHKFILPRQNHLVFFTSNTDMAKCDSIRALLDAVLEPSQGVDKGPSDQVPSTKFLKNGQLLIRRDGKIYNILGAKVK